MTTHERHLIEFLKSHLAASDVPNISHSNALIPTLSALLTEQNLFLLLEWIREGRWLKTLNGDKSPIGSFLFDEEWKATSQINDIPFIDQDYYSEKILSFKQELQMLGVVIGFNQNYELVANNLKSPVDISARTAESGLFVLECLNHLRSSNKFFRGFKNKKFLKTSSGYMSPVGSYLFHPEWGRLMKESISHISRLPFIDDNDNYYGKVIYEYEEELKKNGVISFEPNMPSLPQSKVLEIYSKIGVRSISESLQKEEMSIMDGVGLNLVNPRENFIGKGFLRLILGFLAKMEVEKRHETVQCLLSLIVLETLEPVTIGYNLSLSSGEVLKEEARQMIRWERESKKFITQNMDSSAGHRSVLKYATNFSEAIAQRIVMEERRLDSSAS
ncbi:hypothetical protein ACSBR1_035474 [Camellia fascicularis]